MVEHSGLPVHGYQPQDKERVALVNEFKQDEERLLRKLDVLHLRDQQQELRDTEGKLAGFLDIAFADPRWVAIARTHFQEGFMALNRAVFQPQRIGLPEDQSAPEQASE